MSDISSTAASSSSKHTPGPWRQDGMFIRGLDNGYICDIKFPDDDPEIQANAILIAAAPELLEALQDLCDSVDNHPIYAPESEAFLRACAAIRKATGNAAAVEERSGT